MSYGGSILWDMAMHFALHIRLHNFASCNFRGKQRKLIAIRPTCFSESRAIAFDRYTLFQPSTFYFNTIFKHIFFVSFDHIGLLSHFYITNIWWLRNPASPNGWLKPQQNHGMFTIYQLVQDFAGQSTVVFDLQQHGSSNSKLLMSQLRVPSGPPGAKGLVPKGARLVFPQSPQFGRITPVWGNKNTPWNGFLVGIYIYICNGIIMG